MDFNNVTLNAEQTLSITGGRGRGKGDGKRRENALAKLAELGVDVPEDASRRQIRELIKANRPEEVVEG